MSERYDVECVYTCGFGLNQHACYVTEGSVRIAEANTEADARKIAAALNAEPAGLTGRSGLSWNRTQRRCGR